MAKGEVIALQRGAIEARQVAANHDKEFTRLLGDHLLNAKGLYDYGIKRGLMTPEELRLTIAKRQETAKALVDGGMSVRAAAKLLGVSHMTVQRDVEQNVTENVTKRSTRELLGQSDQNDWRTPRKFLDAAREVLGAIDLDPASGPEANETVKAAKFYTKAGRRPRRGGVDCRRAAHARGTRKGRAGEVRWRDAEMAWWPASANEMWGPEPTKTPRSSW
jgi:hypothetical protein